MIGLLRKLNAFAYIRHLQKCLAYIMYNVRVIAYCTDEKVSEKTGFCSYPGIFENTNEETSNLELKTQDIFQG